MTMATLQLMPQFLSKLKNSAVLLRMLPAEWSSAVSVYAEMAVIDASRVSERRKARVLMALQFIVGAIPSACLAPSMAGEDATIPSMLIASLLALSALLVGFVVTLMLFTGAVGKPELLKLEQLKEHATRVLYLLTSQATTLGAALLLAFFSTVWLGLFIAKADVVWLMASAFVSGGMLTVSLFRTVLLPLQIYELHSAALKDLIKAKASEVNARYDSSG